MTRSRPRPPHGRRPEYRPGFTHAVESYWAVMAAHLDAPAFALHGVRTPIKIVLAGGSGHGRVVVETLTAASGARFCVVTTEPPGRPLLLGAGSVAVLQHALHAARVSIEEKTR